MKSKEQQQADELDRYLDSLQSGRSVPPHPSLPDQETTLIKKLVEMQNATQLDPAYAGALEQRLHKAASVSTQNNRIHPVLQWLSDLVSGNTSMKPLFGFSLAGIVLVVLIVAAYFIFRLEAGPLPIAQTATKTASALETSLAHTATLSSQVETPVNSVGIPTNPVTTPTNLNANQPVDTPAPTQNLPTAAPLLPGLAQWLNGGFGGGSSMPVTYEFRLDTSVSGEQASLIAYLEREPGPFNIQQAAFLADALGLDQPQWFSNIAIQDPRQIVFQGNNAFDYLDRSVFNFPAGRYYYPPDSYPSPDLASENAQNFLKTAGLLDEPYTYTIQADNVFFFRIVGDREVFDAFARVTVAPDGRIGMVHFDLAGMDAIGTYPVISSEQAWQVLDSASQNPESASRVYIRVVSSQSGNPRIWIRDFQDGEKVDIFVPLTILEPSEVNQPVYIRTSNGLVIKADATSLQSLATDYRQLVENSSDQGIPIHIWGTIKNSQGYQELYLDGWDTQSYNSLWQGTLEKQDDSILLLLEDGSTVPLASSSNDLPIGEKVFVEGFTKDGTLEWTVVQEFVEGMSPSVNDNQDISITKVELAYLAPQTTTLAQTKQDSIALRTLQPVWVFSGQTENGDLIRVFVQAIDPGMIKH